MGSELDKVKSAFRRGLAGLSLLAERNAQNVEHVDDKVDRVTDRLEDMRSEMQNLAAKMTRLEERIPPDLKADFAALQATFVEVKDSYREDTKRVRKLEANEAAGIKTDKTTAAKWQVVASVVAAIVAALAAVASAIFG